MAKAQSSHDPIVAGNAAALTTAIVYVVCRVLVGMFPGLMLAVARSWFHTTDLGQMRPAGGLDVFVLGLVTSVVFAWLVGYLFGWAYTMFAKK